MKTYLPFLALMLFGACASTEPAPPPEEESAPSPAPAETPAEADKPVPKETPKPKETPAPSGPEYGKAVNALQAHLYLAKPVFDVDERIRVTIRLKNTGESGIRFHDMNDPKSWSFSFTRVDDGAYYGCWARVELEGDGEAYRPLVPASQAIEFSLLLPGRYGGWNTVSKRDEKGRRMALCVGFPPPGRYEVVGVFHPVDNSRPHLMEVPGYGMKTQAVSLTVRK
jgi:hypothetical protein